MLSIFFDELKHTEHFKSIENEVSNKLSRELNIFFDVLQKTFQQDTVTSTNHKKLLLSKCGRIDPKSLAPFLGQLNLALALERQSGNLFDPWEAMNTGRKEVRCCESLKWLLDPSSSHGFGTIPINGLLSLLNSRSRNKLSALPWSNIPENASYKCLFKLETPESTNSLRRIDISIIDPGFELIIEAKIDAKESHNQVFSYCEKTDKRIQNKLPWLLIFLTHDGREPETAGTYKESRTLSISWAEIATYLSVILRSEIENKISQKSEKIHARDYFIKSFLKSMRQLSKGRK